MPSPRTLRLLQNNGKTLAVVVYEDTTPPYTTPYDLTGLDEVTLILKATKETADADGEALTLTDGAIAITVPLEGQMEIDVPASALAIAGRRWYRLDVEQAGSVETVGFGYLVVRDT